MPRPGFELKPLGTSVYRAQVLVGSLSLGVKVVSSVLKLVN